MDKNNILRTYSIRYGSPEVSMDKKEIPFLYQFSQFQDEFGTVTIIVYREMEGEFPVLRAGIQHNKTRNAEEYYSILNSELAYFTNYILPLFNPLTFNKDALPFQEKE